MTEESASLELNVFKNVCIGPSPATIRIDTVWPPFQTGLTEAAYERPTWGGTTVAQTIEAFVGSSLDEAKISPLHVRVIGLIAAGYFFDVIDFTMLRLADPGLVQRSLRLAGGTGLHRHATVIFGMAIGTAGQGEFSDRFGRRFDLPVQPAAVRHLHDPRRACADRHLAHCLPLHRRHRPRRRAAARLRVRGRVLAQAHPRPHPGDRAFHRRRLRVADRTALFLFGALVAASSDTSGAASGC